MTDHPSDDFDERLRAAARDYNRPADVPRERMWTAIRAARASRATVPVPQRRTRRVWFVPAAAAAVLIIGIAIGRVSQNWTVAPGTSLDVSPKPDSRATSPGPIAVIDSSIKPESTERDSVPRHAQLATRDSQPDSRSTPAGISGRWPIRPSRCPTARRPATCCSTAMGRASSASA